MDLSSRSRMTPRAETLLPLDVSAAVAAVAYGHLEDAASALADVDRERTPKALHNFRLAVRRLRTLLDAYRPWLGDAAGDPVQKALRKLGRRTNKGRDADVRLAWIQSHRKALPRNERKSTRRILRKLKAARRKGLDRASGSVQRDFTSTAQRLVRRLEKLDSTGPSLAEVLPSLLRRQASELEVHLVAVLGVHDNEGAHEARIAGKNLRYLIEPLRKESQETDRLLERLKTLQDLLGELNDLHLVQETLDDEMERLARAEARRLGAIADRGEGEGEPAKERRREEVLGIEALSTIARARRNVLFGELQHAWLSGRGRDFFEDVEELAQTLGSKTADEQAVGEASQDFPSEEARKPASQDVPSAKAPQAATPRPAPVAQIEGPEVSEDRAVLPLRPQQNRSYAPRKRSAN